MYNYGEWYFINGIKQYIHIISVCLDNPILVYLHGGPGDAALPLVEHFNSELSNAYTLIIWEQRGAGKSYYKFAENDYLAIDDFVLDLKELIEILLLEFKKEKVCILGHSWGSIIGMKFITLYPELVTYYIGVGQVICSRKMFEISKDYVMSHAKNPAVKAKLSSIDISFNQSTWYSGLMYLMRQIIKQGVSLYGQSSYFPLYKYFVRSKNYSRAECIKRLKGSEQSIQKLWGQVMEVDFSSLNTFAVPIAFIEGANDFHASSRLVNDFFAKITTPKKYYRMDNAAHFPQWTRPDTFNFIVNSLKVSSFSNSNEVSVI